MSIMAKVVVVTGANSGIGLALCERLLSEDAQIRLCLACRNPQRAASARAALLTSHPSADIDIVMVDVGCVSSILKAAAVLKERYQRVDYLYLNAGIMPNPRVSIKAFFTGLFSRNAVSMFATGQGLLTQEDRVTRDGMQEVFETNVFGHFILIRELEPLLCHTDSPSQLIWTSSSNARKSAFSLTDYQHSQGQESYSSSKYATDLLSVSLNKHFNQQGLYSSVICPGLVMTNLTYGIFPSFFWMLIMPIMYLVFPEKGVLPPTVTVYHELQWAALRIIFSHAWKSEIRVFTNTFTLTPYNGAEALLWLFKQKPESLDPLAKYHSFTSGLGNSSVKPIKMDIDEETSEQFYQKLLVLEKQVRERASEPMEKRP